MKDCTCHFFVAMESPTLIDDFFMNTSIYRGCSIATLDYQRVTLKTAIAGSGSADRVEISVGA